VYREDKCKAGDFNINHKESNRVKKTREFIKCSDQFSVNNRPDLSNPHFLVFGDPRHDWSQYRR